MDVLKTDKIAIETVRRVSSTSEVNSELERSRKLDDGNSFISAASAFFSDFAKNSSCHGIKYLGERRRHWSERLFWIIAFLISLFGCLYMIFNIYMKWQMSPVIVSFAEKSTPVWQIPFPAITICPETKALKKYVDFTKVFQCSKNINDLTPDNLTETELEYFETVAQICDLHIFHLSNITSKTEIDPNRIVPILKKISKPTNETNFICKWRSVMIGCQELFHDIVTEEGICQTFNILDSKELLREENLASDFQYLNHNITSNWTLEGGYRDKSDTTYPRRVLGPGARGGLNLVLTLTDFDLDYMCRGPVQGFKVLLHTPGEIPRLSKQYFRVPLKQEVVVSVKPNMMTTSERLKDYSPNRRQCYFNDEKYLKYFKVYTQNNCELECLTNYTLSKCECVKFSMPRDSDMKICGADDIKCYDDAENELLKEELNAGISSFSESNKAGDTMCDCLPSCTSINYDAEISQADFDYVNLFQSYGENMSEYENVSMARLTVFFKEAQFITSKRSELYGLTDFMANCGGLLGLFMGVSILSLIEILYYLSLRFACNLNYRKKKNNKISLRDSMGQLSEIPKITLDSKFN